MKLIKVENLAIGYEAKPILEKINFEVNKGDFFCIVGENGSGKSTLMKTLLTLLPKLKGEITLEAGLKQKEFGYLPQTTQIQKDFPASVEEVVMSGFLNNLGFRPIYNKSEKTDAKKQMKALGIDHLAKKSFRDLSGGQQQRVLLARCLCATKKLVLLDEPVAGLDVKVTKSMYQTIEKLNIEMGITVIMISHDINAALAYANKILYLDKNGAVLYPKNKFDQVVGKFRKVEE